MKRLFANALLLVGSLTVSTQLLALGLGELTLKSALNQPLAAEIVLVDSEGLSEWEIKPVLASAEAFERSNVERSYFLTKIKFQVVGDKVVLTTRDSVTEPFLNFLVELNWPSGRVVREFTVLLDPPTFAEESYQPLVSTPTSTATATGGAASAPAAASRPAAPTNRPAPSNHNNAEQWQSDSGAPGTYRVQPNDTLWAIALATRPDPRITPQQMMVAIQQQNPDAFIGGNINRLKTHQVLRIPDSEQIRTISFDDAVSEVARQNQEIAGAAQLDATGRAATTPSARATSTGGEVRLVSDRGEQSGSAGASGEIVGRGDGRREALENDLAIALETLDKSRRENNELVDRLASLEEQIAALQRLVSLKDDQLANLQVNAGQDNETSALATPASEAGTTPAAGAIERSESVADSAEGADTEPKPDTAAAAVEPKQPKPEMAEQRPKPRVIPPPPAPSMIDRILQDPIMLGGVLAVLLLLIALIYSLMKKLLAGKAAKKAADDDAEAALLQEASEEVAAAASPSEDFDHFNFDQGSSSGDSDSGVQLGDHLFDDDALDISTDSLDAPDELLTAVDADIAYGRFDEARSKLTPAVESQPGRTDLSLKLLEVLAELNDDSAFADEEARLLGFGSDDDITLAEQFRSRLSNPIAPSTHALSGISLDDLDMEFQSELDNTATTAEAETPVTDMEESIDIMPVLGDDAMDFETALDQGDDIEADLPAADDNGMDFSLDSLADSDEHHTDEITISADDQGVEFDLSAFEDSSEELAAEPETEVSEPEHDNLMDFDVSDDLLAELSEEPLESDASAGLSDDNVMEFDLDGLDVPELGEVEEESLADTDHGSDDNVLEFDVPELDIPELEVEEDNSSTADDEESSGFDLPVVEADDDAVADDELDGTEFDLEGLDNDLEMLASATEATSASDSAEELTDDNLMEFDLDSLEAELDSLDAMTDLPKLSEEDLSGARMLVNSDDSDDELALPELDELEEFAEAEAAGSDDAAEEAVDELSELDMELDDFDLAELEDEASADSAPETLEDLPELGDLDDIPELEAVTETELPVAAVEEDAAEDELPPLDDLEELTFDLEPEALPELADLEEAPEEPAGESLDEMDIPSFTADSINLDELAETEDEFAYLSGTDANDTKLDLARAYVDMGESDSAKELLGEIVQEGSDHQKQEAQNLLDSLT
ncbi:FimV/HubP family polar landmark protein [Oceanobacter sp. 5_MG-2023]|uniref:FimV/HubP family polar landmark protein n=1 Tax=Oceanobacter sp. 5_MG-2023 TaxID=3062645 RepID=UPI0026E1F90D|nr:FimV/HubP family polar landmark protein [Oceanobacter sp. 5_MG-2023]MDO6683458.1 FimV/HubP family polar landmark protein [Oceanobacter sp. 5_MG-2023]